MPLPPRLPHRPPAPAAGRDAAFAMDAAPAGPMPPGRPSPQRRALLLGGAAAALGWPLTATAAGPAACPSLLNHRIPRLQDEQPQALCQYAGKVLLVVNTASRCGYTGQYADLERLHQRLSARGLVVLGFPSHDFRQELGSNAEVAAFCESTFGVRFPLFSPTRVRGPQAHPFYAELARRGGGAPAWNFHKYLVDRSGQRVQGFPSPVKPEDPVLLAALEKLLDAKTD